MDLAERLMQEKRARLGAERLLAQKQAELSVANRELSKHARALSVQVIEKREEVAEVRSDLEAAETKVTLAERRLWTSLSTIPDGFAVFDQSDRLVAANAAWLLPFDGLAMVAPGALYADILTVALEEGMIDPGTESRQDWHARMLARWQRDRPDPVTIRLWNGTFVRLVDRRGEGGDMVSLALDISPQMRGEARLKAARRRAEAANRAKSAFLANMSHELRTPMNGVVAMADLLAESALDEDQRAAVETIRSSGEALLVIINDILDLSKIDAHKMVLHAAPFDLEVLCHDLLRLMQPLAQRKGLRLAVDYDVFMPTEFEGDIGRLRQILTNLIGNAVKFTDEGHVLVRVSGVEAPAGGWSVHVAVEDTGIGIPRHLLRHVFGEFNQVEDDRNRRYDGTGLGLPITERLVRLMGGDIWVESEPGQGSCFGFRIPLPEAAGGKGAAPLPAPRRVMVIDPDPAAADLLRGQLLALGMTVSLHGDPVAALAGVPADCGAVLAVGGMPEMGLADLLRGLRDAASAVPLLALCDDGAAPEIAGLAGHLPRPTPRRALIAALSGLPLPAAAPPATDAPPAAAPPATEPEPAEAAPPLRAMRVLAAEDNKTNQLVLGRLLKSLDIDLRFADDGHQAVARWSEWHPDLVFMDISMPGMDGKAATRAIRAAEAGTGRHTPICALTAHALGSDEADILAAGLDFYLTKPLKKPALLERILAARPDDCRPVGDPAEVPADGTAPAPPVSGPATPATGIAQPAAPPPSDVSLASR